MKRHGTVVGIILLLLFVSIFSCSEPLTINNGSNARSLQNQATDWTPWVYYATGQVINYNNKTYECIQAHTSQPDWYPSIVPALWKVTSVQQQMYPFIDLWSTSETYMPGQWVEYGGDFYYATLPHAAQMSWQPSAAPSVWTQIEAEEELAPNYDNILYNSHFNWKVGGWPILEENSFFSDNMWHVAGISTSYGKLKGTITQDISGKPDPNTPYQLSIRIRNVNDAKVKISIQQQSGEDWNDIVTTGWRLLEGKGEPKDFKGADGRWYKHILGNLETIEATLTTGNNVSGKLRFIIETDTAFNDEIITLYDLTLSRQPFAKVLGDKIMVNNEEFHMRGIAFTNFYYLDKLGSYVRNDFTKVKHHRQEDFYEIKKLGFNTIRFALNGEWFIKGNVKSDSQKLWTWIDNSIEMAKNAGLYVLLEMHIPPGQTWLDAENAEKYDRKSSEWFWNDDTEIQRLNEIWEAIAERYSHDPTIIAYGLLNEPKGVDETGAQWYNEVLPTLIQKVRNHDTNHILIADGYTGMIHYNNQDGLGEKTQDTLEIRVFSDPNIIYDAHFYETGEYTHKGAKWGGGVDNKSSYPDDHAPMGNIWGYWAENAKNGYSWKNNEVRGTTKDLPTSWTTLETAEYTINTNQNTKGKEGDSSDALVQPKLVVAGDVGSAMVLFDNAVLWERKAGSNEFVAIREIPVEAGVKTYLDEYGKVVKTEDDKTSDGWIYWAEDYWDPDLSDDNWDSIFTKADANASYGKQVIKTDDGSNLDPRYSDKYSVGVSGSKALAVWIQTWLVVMANEGSTYKMTVDMKVIGTPATDIEAGPILQFYKDPRPPRPSNVQDEKLTKDEEEALDKKGGYRLDKGFNRDYLERNFVRDYRPFSFWTNEQVPETILEFGLMDICYADQNSGIDNGGDQWMRDMMYLFSKYNVGWATWSFRNEAMGMFRDLKEATNGSVEDYNSYVDWNNASHQNKGIFNAVKTIMAR